MWSVGIVAFALGVLVGIGLTALYARKAGRSGKLQREVERLQAELADYRTQVTAHFRKTATLVGKMTESYRDVYEHLAQSSQQLCEAPFQSPQLEMTQAPSLPAQETEASTIPGDKPAKTIPRRPPDHALPMDEIFGDAPHVPDRSPLPGGNI